VGKKRKHDKKQESDKFIKMNWPQVSMFVVFSRLPYEGRDLAAALFYLSK
jgi:hypothetical protein